MDGKMQIQARSSLHALGTFGMTAAVLAAAALASGCSLSGKQNSWSQASVDRPVEEGPVEDLAGQPLPAPQPTDEPSSDTNVAQASYVPSADVEEGGLRGNRFRLSDGGALPHRAAEVVEVNSKTFAQTVLQSDAPVLVDFSAKWCGPCRALAPVLDQLAREEPGIRIVKIDIDDSPDLARRYGVSSIPALRVFRDGQVTARHVGRASKQKLRSLIGVAAPPDQLSMNASR